MRNVALLARFDGRNYHGWQRQQNGMTVQQRLEEAIASCCGGSHTLYGCSRTDAGVHALSYVCNFHTAASIPTKKLVPALNCQLPGDIRVFDAIEVPDDFHARHSCRGKRYRYLIDPRQVADPFLLGRAWHRPFDLDLSVMRQAASRMLGRHDFSCFMAADHNHKTTQRTIRSLHVDGFGDGLVAVEIEADAYLYNMVRIITGTLFYCGIGKLSVEAIPEILKSRDRTLAGPTAPPDGLYLVEVQYDISLQRKA